MGYSNCWLCVLWLFSIVVLDFATFITNIYNICFSVWNKWLMKLLLLGDRLLLMLQTKAGCDLCECVPFKDNFIGSVFVKLWIKYCFYFTKV